MTDKTKNTDTYRDHKGDRDANRDPITDAPGAHPVGSGVGAAVGTVVGAAAGALGGPAGMAAGAAIGAAVVGGVVGGLAGKAAGEKIDPTVEDAHWSKSYASAPYVAQGSDYKRYQPAYKYGWESYARYDGRNFDQVESELGRDWEKNRDGSPLTWDNAKPATRDAWRRVERAVPGDGR
ncbi:MAG: hypothetical protein KBH14_02525 [Vicinamibacteria bacterium]|jgi:hypothetical protein|nr:hypothetical protein [Vicinamibacteria bacterium]